MTPTLLSDGSALHSSWDKALSDALTQFRILSSQSNRTWKPIATNGATPSATTPASGIRRDFPFHPTRSSDPLPSDVVLHKRSSKKGDVFRAAMDWPLVESDKQWYDVEVFKGLLQTPETVGSWDNMVEGASVLDVLDVNTRINSTRYRLGWPASPRDAITISKTFCDGQNLVLVSTSLPRSPNEPAYLRPAPPYVRANIGILAWHIQTIPAAHLDGDVTPGTTRETLRITCFWQWDPKGSWLMGASLPSQLPNMLVNLFKHAKSQEARVPTLSGFGAGVDVGDLTYDTTRVVLGIKYVVVSETESEESNGGISVNRSVGSLEGAEALEDLKERRRLFRAVEFGLWPGQSWDVQIHVKGSTSSTPLEWTSFVGRYTSLSSGLQRLVLRLSHPRLASKEDLARVSISIERTTGAPTGVRINGVSAQIEEMEPRSKFTAMPIPLSEQESAFSGVSFTGPSETGSILSAVDEILSAETTNLSRKVLGGTVASKLRSGRQKRSAAEEKAIASMIKRNYIYFTSLLQEPEAKWKPINEGRGVALHQLRSIDPTLNVLRAEGVFVGIGIWDMYAVVSNWGSSIAWDTGYDDAILLEHLNEFSELWWVKGKAAWSTAARENVLLRTTYKTAESIHLVGMSVDDKQFFPNIPEVGDGATRLQTDLQGWSIESLSPNTVQVSLIEQRDPRSKSSLLQVVAAAGEQAIKSGAPPVVTSLTGAKAMFSRYENDKGTYRFEYQPSASIEDVRPSLRPMESSAASMMSPTREDRPPETPAGNAKGSRVECQFRCDCDTWSSSIEITVDPPPLQASALKRHRVSGYGGLWFTIEHDRETLGSDKVTLSVRKGLAEGTKDRPMATVNGSKVKIQLEELPSADVESLKKQKRGRPQRQPLDRPALPMLRRRMTSIRDGSPDAASAVGVNGLNTKPATLTPTATAGSWAYPFTAFYGMVSDATKAAVIPVTRNTENLAAGPREATMKALAQVLDIHDARLNETAEEQRWIGVGGKKEDGFVLERRDSTDATSVVTYRSTGIMRGFSAREVLSVIQGGAKAWDDRVQSEISLATYGDGIEVRFRSCSASVMAMPIRGRGFLVASSVASSSTESGPTAPNEEEVPSFNDRFFVAVTSLFEPGKLDIDEKRYNPIGFTYGRVLLEGWILEDLDAYSPDTYEIPSSRCTYISAYDFQNVPSAVNNTLNYNRHAPVLTNMQRLLRAAGPRPLVTLPASGFYLTREGRKSGLKLSESLKAVVGAVTLLAQRSEKDGDAKAIILVKPGHEFAPPEVSVPRALRRPANGTSGKLSSWRSHSKQNSEATPTSTTSRLVFSEVYVEARQEDVTFTVSITGTWAAPASGAESDITSLDDPVPDVDQPRLPYVLEVVRTPRSLLRTSSTDPNITGFTVRVALEILPAAAVDPLSPVKTVIKPFVPPWLATLRSQGCVVGISIAVRSAAFGTGHRFVWRDIDVAIKDSGGERLAGPRDWPILDRPLSTEDAAGTESRPLAIAHSMRCGSADVPPASTAEIAGDRAVSPSPIVGTPSRPGTPPATPSEPSARQRPASARSNSLYQFFTYPARTTVAAPRSALSDQSITVPPREKQPAAPNEGVSAISAISSPLTVVVSSMAQSQNLGPQIPLAAVVILGLVCFLLGSLFRSLVTHQEDFVVFLPAGVEPVPVGSVVDWKELRRVMQIGAFGWHVIVGVFGGG